MLASGVVALPVVETLLAVVPAAVGAGLLRGDASGLLMPKGEANRAQAAAMLNRFVENVLK